MHKLVKIFVGASAAIGVASSIIVAAAAIEARSSAHDHIIITGQSMSPTIAVGDVITIDPLRHPHVGDVVTFARNGKKVTHRVIDMWGSFDPSGAPRLLYKTKGDNNRTEDPWVVTDQDVLGVQIPTPAITRLAHPLSSRPLVLALLVAPLMVTMLGIEIRNITRTVHALRNGRHVAHSGADK